jgi:hypothetical protein
MITDKQRRKKRIDFEFFSPGSTTISLYAINSDKNFFEIFPAIYPGFFFFLAWKFLLRTVALGLANFGWNLTRWKKEKRVCEFLKRILISRPRTRIWNSHRSPHDIFNKTRYSWKLKMYIEFGIVVSYISYSILLGSTAKCLQSFLACYASVCVYLFCRFFCSAHLSNRCAALWDKRRRHSATLFDGTTWAKCLAPLFCHLLYLASPYYIHIHYIFYSFVPFFSFFSQFSRVFLYRSAASIPHFIEPTTRLLVYNIQIYTRYIFQNGGKRGW